MSSLFGLFFHSLLMSKRSSLLRRRLEPADFPIPLCLCSMSAVAGNVLFSYSVTTSSLPMALLGRVLVGFGSAECLNRQLLSTVLGPESTNAEASRLAKMSMLAIPVALLLGSLLDVRVPERLGFSQLTDAMSSNTTTPDRESNVSSMTVPDIQPFRPPPPSYVPLLSLESVGYVMAFAWLIHLLGMIGYYEVPKPLRKVTSSGSKSPKEEEFDSDIEKQLQHVKNKSSFGSAETNPFISEEIGHRDGTLTF